MADGVTKKSLRLEVALKRLLAQLEHLKKKLLKCKHPFLLTIQAQDSNHATTKNQILTCSKFNFSSFRPRVHLERLWPAQQQQQQPGAEQQRPCGQLARRTTQPEHPGHLERPGTDPDQPAAAAATATKPTAAAESASNTITTTTQHAKTKHSGYM